MDGLRKRYRGARALVACCNGHRKWAGIISISLLTAGLLSGCATNDAATTFMIDPAHYSVYHCDGLQARLKALQARQQELSNLMVRASEGSGGALIGNLTYRADYENVLGGRKSVAGRGGRKEMRSSATAAASVIDAGCVHRRAGHSCRSKCGAGFSERPGHSLTSGVILRRLSSR